MALASFDYVPISLAATHSIIKSCINLFCNATPTYLLDFARGICTIINSAETSRNEVSKKALKKHQKYISLENNWKFRTPSKNQRQTVPSPNILMAVALSTIWCDHGFLWTLTCFTRSIGSEVTRWQYLGTQNKDREKYGNSIVQKLIFLHHHCSWTFLIAVWTPES